MIRIYNSILCFSYGCKNLFSVSREGHKLQIFVNKIRKIFVPARDEVTEPFGILYNEDDLSRSASLVGARVAQS
jgi:hypothetical protein